jgi:S-adenosylmethionine:tRNA ribosyltransferase-isomerase
MQLSDFNYVLPEKRIAQFPPAERGKAKLLVLDRYSGTIVHQQYPDLINYLQPNDVVVLNNTKVIKARLNVKNQAGQDRELLLLEHHAHDSDNRRHKALYHGHLREGESLMIQTSKITVEKIIGNGVVEVYSRDNLLKLAEKSGTVPLPPYMKRAASEQDVERYQTEFAKKAGSVAAPTASLNFTDALRKQLEAKGIIVVNLTLHVGLGTFLPIRVNDLTQHKIHSEYFEIPATTVEAIQKAKQTGFKVTAMGTTVTRTLEFAALKILNDRPQDLLGEADIFIYPGYTFQVVDHLLTNFHAPKSTVLLMAAAFAGWQNLRLAYEEALNNDYQFLSYGDSMFIL